VRAYDPHLLLLQNNRDALHESELRELGQRFEAAKQHMPTRWAPAGEGGGQVTPGHLGAAVAHDWAP
jgi:hypothetical protein